MTIVVERLGSQHERGAFDCGEPPLNDFLRRLASQHEKRDIGRTFVAVEEGNAVVLGYYTLASSRVSFEHVPDARKLPPRVPVPAVLLGRLAVDNRMKGRGLGKRLLLDALWRIRGIAREAGVYAVEVDALHETAAAFYARYGFIPLPDDPLHMYLPMKTIEQLPLDATP